MVKKAEEYSLVQSYLFAHVNKECRSIQKRLLLKLKPWIVKKSSATWEEVLMAAHRVAEEANTAGRVWTAEKLSDMRPLVDNIKTLGRLVKELIEVTDRANERAVKDRRQRVRLMVDVTVLLMKGVVFCYDTEDNRKGPRIPRLVNCVWQCLDILKNPEWRDYCRIPAKPEPEATTPEAASPNESKKKSRRFATPNWVTTIKDALKKTPTSPKTGPSTSSSIQVTDEASGSSSGIVKDDGASCVASVKKVSTLSQKMNSHVQEFIRADIDTPAREDAFRRMFSVMGEIKETLNRVGGGQDFSMDLCQATLISSTDLMEQLVNEIRSHEGDKKLHPLI